MVTQADKAEKRGFYKDAVCFIKEAYKKSKDLQVSYDQVFTKVKCLMIRARNEFELSHLYQCIRAVRKGIMYHQPPWHLYLFCERRLSNKEMDQSYIPKKKSKRSSNKEELDGDQLGIIMLY